METAGRFVAFCWVVVILVWVISAFSVKRTRERQPLLGRVFFLWLIAVVAVLLNGRIREVHLTRVILRPTFVTAIVAEMLVLAGSVIAVWARVTLGRNWSARVTFKENHEL